MCQRLLFGDKDVNAPTAKSVERLKKLERDANKEITIKVFENVGHSLMTWKEFRQTAVMFAVIWIRLEVGCGIKSLQIDITKLIV